MQLRVIENLERIAESIDHIDQFLGKQRNFYTYQRNLMMRRAIAKELDIIGIAIKKILDINPDIPITDARRIVDARNYLTHEYHRVDEEQVWAMIVKNLPVLKIEVTRILENAD
ncbi:HepT-like ribonuclease domain-containing protein [Parabacteroides sp. PF5-6]|uniref:HepT-like ribonuclease domain-containing protein n=1 Tax=Parabacteroides sp. PF5-6 TaxID=1742403 RepID=UPI002405E160|nr:HepT-like ribonuclease domain-containing protein [Parabacteroides sp. PF5-6]MDF9829641.1 uncharacterized protein with HEPN domain [Parabacteroides sp. PF5-6]